jgi:hypothetical protein
MKPALSGKIMDRKICHGETRDSDSCRDDGLTKVSRPELPQLEPLSVVQSKEAQGAVQHPRKQERRWKKCDED